MVALGFALDTVWAGAETALKDLVDPAALRVMIVTMIGTTLVMLVAPEPVTKFLAVAMTAYLVAYLGVGPVWNLVQGFRQLLRETKSARDLAQLKDSGHRFGRVLGDNGARVLIVVALTALGGKQAMARGMELPNAGQLAMRAQAEGGFQLSAVLAGEIKAISLSPVGALNVALAPTAVATIAMGPGSTIQGDPEGDIHHICTDKNEVSDASGGPWTPQFERYFKQAKMKLSDSVNKVRIKGHKGPHPREYHQAVLDRIARAMQGCRGTAQCQAALVDELTQITRELTTAGSKLRELIIKESQG